MLGVMTPSRRALIKSLRTNMQPDMRFRLERARLRARQASHIPALVAGGRLTRPIFIVSAPRSGSHLLFGVLRASSRLQTWRPSEAHEVWEADHHPSLRGWGSNVLDASDVTPSSAARIRRTFFLVSGPRHRLLDKTPRNSLRLPFVDAIFPDAVYVFLLRDGRDNVNSLINAWRSPRYRTYELPEPHRIPGTDGRWWKFVLYPGWRDDVDGPLEVVCAKQWSLPNSHMLRARRDLPPRRCVGVRYEELVERPVDVVARLLDFLELPFEPVVRARAEAVATTPVNVVTPPERGKWRRENPAEIEAVAGLIAPVMAELGYA
jgi:hypothetical protein